MPARPPRSNKHRKNRFKGISMEQTRDHLRAMAAHGNEYAGLPMTVEGQLLTVHPSYKFAPIFNDKSRPKQKPDPRYRERNHWRSVRGYDVAIFEDIRTGRVTGGKFAPEPNAATMQLATMGCAQVWEMTCETKALEKLRTLIKPHLFEMYQLTGQFLETSARSRVTYIFRRLRPTLALSGATGSMKVLAGLCLHPIGYYNGTWAGAMVPTDEVIAHLMLMRGDEHLFWKQANQHAAWRPEAGL